MRNLISRKYQLVQYSASMHGMNYYFECDRPQALVEGWLGVALHPGPSKGGGERAWYTGIASTGPQKNVG